MTIRSKGEFTDTLPATPCTPEMSAAIRKLAIDNKTSIAEIQRVAFAFYLRESARIADSDDTQAKGGDAGE